MSILRTYNVQNPDSASVNVELSADGGVRVAGLSTFSGELRVGTGVTISGGIITATSFTGNLIGNVTGDAATLGGINPNSFLRSDAADTSTGTITFNAADIIINSDLGTNSTTPVSSMSGRLRFDSDYSDTARGPNKIEIHNDGAGWIAGLGVHNNTMSYYSGNVHSWYKTNNATSYTQTLTLDSTGNLTATANVTAYSDASLKENIQTIPNALDKVLNLRGVEFDRIDIEGNPHQIGIIAQEIENIIPEVVLTGQDGIKSVSYGNLVGLLIEAIKEQQEEINKIKKNCNL